MENISKQPDYREREFIDGFDCEQIQNTLLTVERQMIKELLLFLIQPNNYV